MNYRELKSIVASTKGKQIPGVVVLRMSGSRIVVQNDHLTVYENGFYIYEDGGCATVYAVDRCSNLTFLLNPSVEEEKEGRQLPNCQCHFYPKAELAILNEKHFEECDWKIPLTVAAGHRITDNDERGFRRRKAVSIDGQLKDESEYVRALHERALDFSERNRENKRLYAAMDHLTDKQKTIIYLFYFQGVKQVEIAREMGISVQMVKNHLIASRKKLKKFF